MTPKTSEPEITPTPGLTHAQWLEHVLALVDTGQAMLKEPLSASAEELRTQASKAEDLQVEVAEACSQASAWLDFHVAKEYGAIDPDLTIPRAKAILDVRVMHHRMLRDKLEALTSSLKSRMRRAQWHV